jgi:ankyrin repeat protein
MRAFSRRRCRTSLLLAATLMTGCAQHSAVNGDYRVSYIWDHGRVTSTTVEPLKKREQLSRSAKDEIVSTAQPFIVNAVNRSNLSFAKGLVELAIFSPKPFFVQVKQSTITEPRFEELALEVEKQDADGIRLLVNKFHNVNQRGEGQTALSIAAAGGYTKSVATLLELGADPNLSDGIGTTPLMNAVIAGSEETVKLLLQAGANVSAISESGESAESWAKRLRRQAILSLLSQHQG